jgi:hypothetical protein
MTTILDSDSSPEEPADTDTETVEPNIRWRSEDPEGEDD